MRHAISIEASRLEVIYRIGSKIVRALDGLDLVVPAGQLLVVRGRSGSGKTTLLHALAGLRRLDRGVLRIGETEVHRLAPSEADRFRRLNIGLIFQFFNLIPYLTVDMNVALPLLLEGHRLPHVQDRVDELLEALAIGHCRGRAPHEISGGEMQRVAVARALVVKPKVILADEPTGNLDSRTAHEVYLLLRQQVDQRSVTTLLMTHDLDAASYADRVIELRDGRIESDSGAFAAKELARDAR